MERPRWFYVWLVPLLWALISWASMYFPGDEYALSAWGSIAGIWILFLIENTGSPWNAFWKILLAGAGTMATLGLVLDLLRAPRRLWAAVLGVVAVAVCVLTILSYPSYHKAMSKHGSLLAYIFFSLNVGLSLSSVLMLVVAPIVRIWTRPYPPGHCKRCGYDLTGNVSGRCPECGALTPPGPAGEIREPAGDEEPRPSENRDVGG